MNIKNPRDIVFSVPGHEISGFPVYYLMHYAFLINILRIRPTIEKANSIINVETYEPVLVTNEPARVAVNEAGIRIRFRMLRFRAKFFCP